MNQKKYYIIKLKLMSKYVKYILKEIFPIFLIVCFVLTTLAWISQTLRLVHFIDKGMAFFKFFKIIIFLIPSLLFVVLPVVSVISIIFVYKNLQDDRQLIILQSAGINNWGILKPGLFAAFAIFMLSLYFSAYLMPFTYNKVKEETNQFKKGYVLEIIEPGAFHQISDSSTIYVENKNADGSMDGVVLFDNTTPENKTIFFAKHGKIITTDIDSTTFEFIKGTRHSYDKNGRLTKLHFDIFLVVVTNKKSDITRNRTSLELYLNEMLWPDKKLSNDQRNQLITDGHMRIIWPLFSFVFVFLSLSVFLRYPYSRNSERVKKYFFVFFPSILSAYFHFLLQKMAYQKIDYIFLCYANIIICIILSVLINSRKSL